jgi:cytochrome c peroxidase
VGNGEPDTSTQPTIGAQAVTRPALAACIAALLLSTPLLTSGCGVGKSAATTRPLGLDLYAPIPDDNPLTNERVELGRRLFFDPTLSADGTVSCSSCHRPEHGFADTSAVSPGVFGRRGQRNAPTLLNVVYRPRLFLDGRIERLEDLVLHPIQDPLEMDQFLPTLVQRLNARPEYRRAFGRSLGEEVSADGVARALASYLRTLLSGGSPLDRYRGGYADALSPEERHGFEIFVGRGRCVRCHVGPNLSDNAFHNTGVALISGDRGRYAVTGTSRDLGAFRTPTLRNVALTAPYMHDGGMASLEDVVDFYDRGGTANANLDEAILPIGLTKVEKRALLEFLRALTGAPAKRFR